MEDGNDVCFYTISNSAYFPGLVALINSLVLTGNRYSIVVGDCGLTEKQREVLLSYERCRLFELDPSLVHNPTQYKAFAHLVKTEDVVVIIDSDMIVTGNLRPIIERARDGKFCAFANPADRYFAEWETIYGLRAAPRRQTYVCAGFMAFSVSHWPNLLEQWWNACRATQSCQTYQETGDMAGPTSQADQDALNAILMGEYPKDSVHLERFEGQVHRHELKRVRTIDVETLDCEYMGDRPVILHASLTPKPWMQEGATRDTYFRFLRRLLTRSDVPLRPPASLLNPVLSPGIFGWLACHRRYAANMGMAVLAFSYGPVWLNQLAREVKRAAETMLDAVLT